MNEKSTDAFAAGRRFLSGGGVMGRLIRDHDWAATSLGPPEGWPQSLRTAMRLLLNTGHPIYIFWGPDLLCFYNDAYLPSLGTERHPSSLGRPAREVWGEIWDAIGWQLAQVMRGEGATWHENQLLPMTRNGVREDVYWTYSYGPIDDETAPHGVGGVLTICTETTRQVTLAGQLAQSQERLQLALSGGRGIGTWDWDVQADRVVADERFARLYNIDVEKARSGTPVEGFLAGIHPDDIGSVRARVATALRTGELFSEEYRLVGPTGKVSWVMAEGRCVMSADGLPLRFPGVSFDITDRKIIEQRLRELNTDLESKVVERALERGRTWQVSPELLGVVNAKGHFETSNPAWQSVLGWSEAEIASKHFRELVHPDDLATTQAAWTDASERRVPALRFENRCLRRDGSYCWLSWVWVPEDGKIYCSARDITQDKARDQALQQAESALRQSQKMEAVGQLTGGLAHDFNNLLAAISGSLEVVDRYIASGQLDKVGRFLGMARGAVKRAGALTHRLLAFSRRQTLEPKPVDVNRLVTSMEDMIRRTVGPEIDLEVIGAVGLWPTLADAGQLENALLNLCINARDAMPDGGRLTIETANIWVDAHTTGSLDVPRGQYIALSVTDTGVGMSADVVAKAFEPFYTTKPIGAGTGLGLSMTYGFAQQSGGDVRINSQVGKGTTLCIYLPRHHEAASTPEVVEPTSADHEAHGEVVMVIDDEPAVRLLIVELLHDYGYIVLEAADGPSGLRVLDSANRVDLLITDVGLPGGMNGRQVADAARSRRPDLKVLFITGYAENAAIGNAHLERWMSVTTKPFEMDALARKIKEILSPE